MSDNLVIGGATFTGVTGIKATDTSDNVVTFLSGGGGGGAEVPTEALYSGILTLASDATTALNITFPGTLDRNKTHGVCLVRDDNYNGNAMLSYTSWYPVVPSDLYSILNPKPLNQMKVRKSDATELNFYTYYDDTGNTTGGRIDYDNSTIIIAAYRSAAGYVWRAGSYHWYVWGYPAS